MLPTAVLFFFMRMVGLDSPSLQCTMIIQLSPSTHKWWLPESNEGRRSTYFKQLLPVSGGCSCGIAAFWQKLGREEIKGQNVIRFVVVLHPAHLWHCFTSLNRGLILKQQLYQIFKFKLLVYLEISLEKEFLW